MPYSSRRRGFHAATSSDLRRSRHLVEFVCWSRSIMTAAIFCLADATARFMAMVVLPPPPFWPMTPITASFLEMPSWRHVG